MGTHAAGLNIEHVAAALTSLVVHPLQYHQKDLFYPLVVSLSKALLANLPSVFEAFFSAANDTPTGAALESAGSHAALVQQAAQKIGDSGLASDLDTVLRSNPTTTHMFKVLDSVKDGYNEYKLNGNGACPPGWKPCLPKYQLWHSWWHS